MDTVASRDLRNHTADVLRRIGDGESLLVTVNGRVVAELAPPGDRRSRFLSRAELRAVLESGQADVGLRRDLEALLGETTEDLGAPR